VVQFFLPSSVGILLNPIATRVPTHENRISDGSGCGSGVGSYPLMPINRYRCRLQAKCVLARGNHIQRNWMTIVTRVHVLGFKPRAQARVKNFRLALPEIWRQPALDPEVI